MLEVHALMRSPSALLEAASECYAHGNLRDARTFCELAANRLDYSIDRRAAATAPSTAKWDHKAKRIIRKASKHA